MENPYCSCTLTRVRSDSVDLGLLEAGVVVDALEVSPSFTVFDPGGVNVLDSNALTPLGVF